MSAWIVRHGLWVLAAGLVLLLGAGVAGTFTPLTAAALAFAAVVLLVGALLGAGLVTERDWRREERRREQSEDTRRPTGWPAAHLGATAEMREPVRTRPVIKAIERNERRHGGA